MGARMPSFCGQTHSFFSLSGTNQKFVLVLEFCSLLKAKEKAFIKDNPAENQRDLICIAERQGFEPWEQLPVHRISSAARSTTPASFLWVLQNKYFFRLVVTFFMTFLNHVCS